MGKGNEALVYLEKMNVLNDSLNAEETTKKLQQMEFAKQVLQDSIAQAETDRLVLEAHQEEMRAEEKTRNIGFGIGALVLIMAIGLYSRLRYVRKSKDIIESERDRSDNLLLNILPADIAAELKEKGKADARDFDLVSILFTDFKGFTEASAKLSAQDLVSEINICFEAFDGIITKYGVEKIKTIGDAYMAAGGLPVPTDDSVKNTVLAALEMQAFISARSQQQKAKSLPFFEMRVGIHTGPVVAGIVGVKKFQYDIWGDTVNTASRMESAGEVGKVNVSQATYELLKDTSTPLGVTNQFEFESRGKIEAKGKGEMEMWFVSQK
jgi:class 3 adenylate cyclase